MLDKRPATRSNRRYVAEQLKAFILQQEPEMIMPDFGASEYRDYLLWLQEQELSSQAVLNAIGVLGSFFAGHRKPALQTAFRKRQKCESNPNSQNE
jgi:hypothetical protein